MPITGRPRSATKRPMWPAGPQPISSTGPGGQATAKRRRRSTSHGLRESSSAKSAAYCSATRSNAARTLSVLRCRRAAWRRGRAAGRWSRDTTAGRSADSRTARCGPRSTASRTRPRPRCGACCAARPGTAKIRMRRPLGPDPGQRQRGHHVDVGREGRTRRGGRALEDQRLLGDGVEVDLLLDDPRRAGPARAAALRLSIVTDGDRAHGAALDAVETGDGRRTGRGCGSRSRSARATQSSRPSSAPHDSTTRSRPAPSAVGAIS